MENISEDKIRCVRHGALLNPTNFYMSGDQSLYKGIGRIPVCKRCIEDLVNYYFDQYDDMKTAVFFTCRKLDIAFDSGIYDGAIKQGGDAFSVFKRYMTQRNSLGGVNGSMLSFDSGEDITVTTESKEDFEERLLSLGSSELTKDELISRQEIIGMLGYDPFESFPVSDQKYLYSDLINYLSDEEIVEDQYLVSKIIQVVINNSQVRKYDDAISQYASDPEKIIKYEGKIQSLTKLKNSILDTTNKIAKDNGISASARGGRSGKSTLTKTIEKLRELDFEDAEVDYYDQMKAYGMQRVADISMRSMFEQLELDDADVRDIIVEQKALISELQDSKLDNEEEIRKLKVALSKMKQVE